MSLQNSLSQRQVFTVSEITNELKNLIQKNFDSVWIEGEISNCKSYPSGHLYFTLKDETAQISAVIFKGFHNYLKFKLEDGMSVIVHGRLSLYEVRGQYQIVIDRVEPQGVGALQIAFEQLKNKLKAEGLFDEERKRPLPFLPRKIGIITSIKGAVLHDMLTILKRRFEGLHIIVHPVKVQGDGSAQEIVEAFEFFATQKNMDVIIVGRGGGSIEDLWSFNEEIVARAVASCPVPVISAVGHETDFTICDFVADVRTPTPSAAAELCVPVKNDIILTIAAQKNRLCFSMGQFIKQKKNELSFWVKTLPTPQIILERWLLKLSDLENSLYQNLKEKITNWRHEIENCKTRIELLSPLNVLKRGYIMGKNHDGKIVKRKSGLASGDKLTLVFFDGEITTKVEG